MNKVILEGLVEGDPVVRYFGYNHVRADFVLSTTEVFPAQGQENEDREVVLKHRVTAWAEVAQQVETEVQEGQHLRLEGRLTYDKITSHQGEVRIFPVVECQTLTIIQRSQPKASSDTKEVDIPELDWASFAPEEDEDPMA